MKFRVVEHIIDMLSPYPKKVFRGVYDTEEEALEQLDKALQNK